MTASRIPTSFFSAPEASLWHMLESITGLNPKENSKNSLQVDLGLCVDVFWFGRHVEVRLLQGIRRAVGGRNEKESPERLVLTVRAASCCRVFREGEGEVCRRWCSGEIDVEVSSLVS